MAKVVSDDELAVRKDRPGKYPLDRWANGKTWRVTQGDDFSCAVSSFCQSLYRYATRAGKRVNVRVVDKTVTFRFSPKE